MGRTRHALLALALVGLAAVAAPPPAASAPPEELTPEAVKEAIAKGCGWLKGKEGKEGSFVVPVVGGGEDPPGKYESKYTDGTTPLALLTLLKCGVKPDDPLINKGFDWLYEQPNRRIYSVALAILAIEARFAPRPEDLEKHKDRPYETVERQNWRKLARPADVKKLEDLTQWILKNQEKHVWRYPSKGEPDPEDHSNTQYAMLALKSASRLGVEIPVDVFERVAQHFVCQQDPTGPEVPAFNVPTADGPISPDKKPEGATVEKGKERPRMFARGWSYQPRPVGEEDTPPPDPSKNETREKPSEAKPAEKQPTHQVSTGSMTNSGIVALVVCKSELELRDKAWWKRWGPSVDQGIRDGCAWLAKNFSVEHNPPGRGWKYYYLYGLERAGVMAGTYEFGTHDWYDEGALHLLKLQQQDGSWPADSMLADFTDTCFALLFLKRATVPLVKMPPKRTITGFGGKEPAPEPSAKPGKAEKPPIAPEPPKPESSPSPSGK